MSFYDQAMTHSQASHVMAIAHTNSSHVNMLEYSYLHPNRSLHCQVVAHSQSSYVMATCTNKFITCQHIRAHILTSKHVILSQAMTLSNKSHNGPRSMPQQLQTEPRDRPEIGHRHKPRTPAGTLRCSLPLPRQSGSLR